MLAMVAESDSQQAAAVLDQAQTIFNDLGNVVDVGNFSVSVILNEYQKRMGGLLAQEKWVLHKAVIAQARRYL